MCYPLFLKGKINKENIVFCWYRAATLLLRSPALKNCSLLRYNVLLLRCFTVKQQRSSNKMLLTKSTVRAGLGCFSFGQVIYINKKKNNV